MYEQIVEIYQEINSVLCFMYQRDLCLTQFEISAVRDPITLLEPFEEATNEMSAEKYLSVSKIISLAHSLCE